MNITNSNLRYLILGFLIVIVSGFCYSSYLGKQQDEEFILDQASFSEGVVYLQNEQLEEALLLLENVDKKRYKSFLLKYYKAYALLSTGEIRASNEEFQNVIDLNPYITEEPIFMIQYARALIMAENWVGAAEVLEKCKTLNSTEQMPDYQIQVDELLRQINISS